MGQWRDLTKEELKILKDSVKDSDGQPIIYGKEERKKNTEKRQEGKKIKPEIQRREERKLKRGQKNTGGRRRRGLN